MKSWIVTGGIGTGKSSFCEVLARLAGPKDVRLVSADQIVHQAYLDAAVRRQIADQLDFSFDSALAPAEFRSQVRDVVRSSPEKRKTLESVLHPIVWTTRQRLAEEAKAQGFKVLVAEIPLYYETGAALAADRVIVVAASKAVQLSRLQAKRALDARVSQDMLGMQMPLEQKIERADVVIWNDGSVSALENQAHLLLRQTNLCKFDSMVEVIDPPASEAKPAVETQPVAIAQSETGNSPSPTPAPGAETATQGTSPSPETSTTITSSSPSPAEGPQANKAQPPFPEEQSVNALQDLSPSALLAFADSVGWRINASRNKHQLIFDLLGWIGSHNTKITVDGIVEIDPQGFGVIHYPKYSLAPLPEDIFVPAFVVRKFELRSGQRIIGNVKPPMAKDKSAAIDRLISIEGIPVEEFQQPAHFEKLTALFPSERIIMETPKEPSVSARVIDIVAPLGKGQRAIIMASPRSGKTVLLKEMARSITVNHPEIALIVLLLDERPEEVTDFEESVTGCEIYASTFDESPKRHTQVAELVLERAKRLVEAKKDVVILLDSITRLARGYNALGGGGKGRTGSGGMDTKVILKPKKFFGAARNVEEGGSLTIVGTALVETESRMDDVIFEEFKGTGNMEICLDREMAERRIYPAIHVTKSGTRRDDLLYHPDEMRRISMIRRQLAAVPAIEALETLIRNINRTKSNAELLFAGLK